ncbi:restriction endonuclease subunit S [uncultured Anaerobiospirillum sp.]|uniref:restriction endonuclease subunit S n=1 Tax=uncultured Anaerobiospirillum sp. TaxID=265728 RepID=UPI0035A73247
MTKETLCRLKFFKNFKDQCVSTMTGSGGLKRVSSYFINNCPVPLPPLKEQQSITTFLDNKIQTINSALNVKSEQLTILAKYKQSLIYEYVTGKKTVPNA